MMAISTYYSSTHFPRYNESLFSFQSAIVSEIQCNVKSYGGHLEIQYGGPLT